ncbi:MAG: N-acetylmuramidase family protein [Rhizobiaceae bacterium]
MFDDECRETIDKLAAQLEVHPAALMAIIEVESGRRLYAKVDGKNEPLIRFEGHYFDRLLPASARRKAAKLGLARPKAGKIRNPRRQADRWKLLNRAVKINRVAALSSCFWGVGQVMGAHWKWLGYGSVDALVVAARSGAGGQIALMARYVEKSGLVPALQAQDWATFARHYNGTGYAKHAYDKKMAAAFEKHLARTAPATEPVRPNGGGVDKEPPARPKRSIINFPLLRAIRLPLLSIFKRFA